MGLKKVLDVEMIRKQFSLVTAVADLSFSMYEGEIFALLGPNGAGKTTTVRMLNGIIQPDSGKITFHLHNGSDHSPLSSVLGYLPEERGLYQEVSILKTLTFMGIIRGLGRKNAAFAAEKWLEQLELLDRKNEKLNTLSKGNQQKIQFIASVIHNPKFAILDEPFSGFDPINQEKFLDIMKNLASKGTTVLLSAHQMHLVERIADRVLLLNNGKSIAYGTVADIKASTIPGQAVSLVFEEISDLKLIQEDASVARIEITGERHIKVFLKSPKTLSVFLKNVAGSYKLQSVSTEHISLHDAFIEKITRDSEVQNAG